MIIMMKRYQIKIFNFYLNNLILSKLKILIMKQKKKKFQRGNIVKNLIHYLKIYMIPLKHYLSY